MKYRNSILQLARYFQDNPKTPLTSREFMDFWHSLTDEEKDYYYHVDLETGLEILR